MDDFYYEAGDTISDELGGNYIYTGSNWESYDTGGGMDSGNIDTGGGGSLGDASDLGSIAIPDGGVDAQGNPTYVNGAGAPVTADGTPIPSANARTALEGGGFKTLNPNGSVTYEDPDGSVYTVNPNGTYTTAGGTYDPKTGTFIDPTGASGSGLGSLMNSVKSFFKKPDGSYDWGKIAGFGAAAYGMLGGDKKETGGWQGSIPKYTATRQEIQYDDPNRRPGAQGRRYFTDVQYGAEGAAPAAKAAAEAQAQGILANYKTATAPADKWGVGALKPALATPWVKKAADTAGTTTASAAIPAMLTPEEKLAAIRQAAPAPAIDTSPDAFKRSQAYQDFEKSQEGSFGTMDMYESPHFGMQNSGSYGRALDNAYTNWAQQTPVAPTVKAATGRYLQGPTDGMADEINTSIDDRQPAKLSHGEFVVPADVVSHLGNGNSDAGAKKLYSMMDKVRQARTGTKKQGKRINPDKYMPGGTVNKYAKGGIANLPVKKFETGGATRSPAADTTTSSTLSPWVGDFVADYLGKGQALANTPYQAYTGPLTAGPSALQEQAFAGASNLASTGYDPTQFTSGTFDTATSQKYMNPYLQAVLDPQLESLRREKQISMQGELGKLGRAGGFGGGRQAVLEARMAEALMREQNKTVGQAYSDAYNKAMDQFNTEQKTGLDYQKAAEQSRQYGADYGIKSLQELEKAGATQRGIEAEGIAADKAQFEEQREWPYKMVQYQQGLLQGLPVTTQSNTQNMSGLTSLLSNAGFGIKLQELINQYLNPSSTTPTTTSPGTTNTASPGTTKP